MTFKELWNNTHDWEFTDSGLYELRFKSAYAAGWDACSGLYGGLTYEETKGYEK